MTSNRPNRAHTVPVLVLAAAAALAAGAAAPARAEPIVDAAVEGHGGKVTKAYFFRGDLVVTYDWGKDRVDDELRPMASLLPALGRPELAGGLRTAGRAWGNSGSYYGAARMEVTHDDADPAADYFDPSGTSDDAAIHGLGAFALTQFIFSGAQVSRYDSRPAGAPVKPVATSGLFKLPPDFAGRIDAAVNGAGNFAGYGYLFHDDLYAKIDWSTGRAIGKPTRTQPKWPGLVELLAVADAVRAARPEVAAAIAILRRDLAANARDEEIDARYAPALAAFGIEWSHQRAQLDVVIARLVAIEATLADPSAAFAFRTPVEAKADGVPATSSTYETKGRIAVTPTFAAMRPPCRHDAIVAMLAGRGMTPPVPGAVGLDASLNDGDAYVRLIRELSGGRAGSPCRK